MTKQIYLIIGLIYLFAELPAQVFINEIAYGAGTNSNCAFELYNPSTTSINLNNYVISNGVDSIRLTSYSITPGQHLRIVRLDKPLFCQHNEIALYSDLSIAANFMIDYIQFRDIASTTLSTTAVNNNVWDSVNDYVDYNNALNIARVFNINKAARGGFDVTLNHWRADNTSIHSLTIPNPCPDEFINSLPIMNKQISSVESKYADYETDGLILSDQILESVAVVDYDSRTEINLISGFEVKLGAVLSAFIDGCNLGQGGLHD